MSAIATSIAAKDIIWDANKKTKIKFTRHGYVFIACTILLVVLPIVEYLIQNKIDEGKDHEKRVQQDNRDAQQRRDYQASVAEMRREFEKSNNNTVTIITQTLGKYGDSLDRANRALRKLMMDSGNMKIIPPEQPVLQLIEGPWGKGIDLIKRDSSKCTYQLNFISGDAPSCCFDLKISAAIEANPFNFVIYKERTANRLNSTRRLSKNQVADFKIEIDNDIKYDWLYLWVRGSYQSIDGKKSYIIDDVYFNHKGPNTWGLVTDQTRKAVIEIVKQYEK